MQDGKQVKDMMVPAFDYPHVAQDASVRDAMAAIRKASENTGGRVRFRSVIVTGKDSRLVGVLSIKDLLKAIEPDYMRAKPKGFEGYAPDTDAGLVELMKNLFTEKCREEAGKKVSEAVNPVKATVNPGDSIAKAVYLMLHKDMTMLPVTEGDKVVGALRLIDVFQEVRDMVLNG